MKLILRQLTLDDEHAFISGLNEWDGEDLSWYTFLWKPEMKFPELIDRLEKDLKGIELPEGRVPHTMLYGFVDGRIVGRVSVRHTLNETLRRRSGHMGYAVAPRCRKRGYATEMFQQALRYCQTLGLAEIMLSCAETNAAS